MSASIYHPAGCRCPGCLPRQYVMRPASPPRTGQPGTAYRHPPQRGTGGDIGILIPALLIFLVVAVVGFWPAMVFHGEGGPTGTAWRWDIHSTVAELVYWGSLIAAGLIIWVCRKYADPGLPPGWRPPQAPSPQAPPVCVHRAAVPVDLSTGERAAWWCPDCEKQLDADWKPPAPAVPAPVPIAAPGAGWSWHWWCTCGRNRSGWAATDLTAQDAINRGVAAHQGTGHRYQYEWKKSG